MGARAALAGPALGGLSRHPTLRMHVARLMTFHAATPATFDRAAGTNDAEVDAAGTVCCPGRSSQPRSAC